MSLLCGAWLRIPTHPSPPSMSKQGGRCEVSARDQILSKRWPSIHLCCQSREGFNSDKLPSKKVRVLIVTFPMTVPNINVVLPLRNELL